MSRGLRCGEGTPQIPIRLRSGQALGYARDDKSKGGACNEDVLLDYPSEQALEGLRIRHLLVPLKPQNGLNGAPNFCSGLKKGGDVGTDLFEAFLRSGASNWRIWLGTLG
jgi:hypothetical protein